MNQSDIDNRFAFHAAPDEEKRNAHSSVRMACHAAATRINELIPDECREKSLAITALEESMFWANAALARLDSDGKRL
jgi:hypothetical protein